MTDRQNMFDGVATVREGHGFPEDRLEAWLQANLGSYHGPLTVQQFKGGQSNPTYKLVTPGHNYVLRRKPPGPVLKGAHAVEREFRVISALGSVKFPVPRVYALCTDETVIGTAFYVMDMVEGRIFWDSTFPGLDATQRRACFSAMNETIARLHKIDFAALGLADYGRPGNYFQRQITRWANQYQAEEDVGRIDAMDRLIDWLQNNIPPGDETSIVHGDPRADNFIFHPTEPRILATLDWELSTLGNPLADFTYNLMMYRLPPEILGGFAGTIPAPGTPSEQDYVSEYCRHTGRAGIENLDFYLAFNMFRLSAIVHGVKGRLLRGNASSEHARALAATLPNLTNIAWAQTGA